VLSSNMYGFNICTVLTLPTNINKLVAYLLYTMNEIVEHNDIIHIYDNKDKYVSLENLEHLNLKYLYFVDYDTNNANFININSFVHETDKINIFTNKIIAKKGQLNKNAFNLFVKNKVRNENYKMIVYDFTHLKSVYFISNMLYNTRVYRIKTILCYFNKVPLTYRENIDIVLS
jgi:hypothetical protein